MKPCTFQPKLEKIKKSATGKFLIFQETKTPKKFLIFSEKKGLIIFQKTETSKKFLTFRKVTFRA